MSISTSVSSATQNLAQNAQNVANKVKGLDFAKYAAKGVGIAGLGAVLYDAHQYGKIQARTSGKNQLAESACDAYMGSTTLNSTSTIDSKLQNARLNAEVNGSIFGGIRKGFAQAKGYIKGAITSLAENIVPLALSAATLVTGGVASKILGAATAIYGGVRAATVAFGIGKPNPLSK